MSCCYKACKIKKKKLSESNKNNIFPIIVL